VGKQFKTPRLARPTPQRAASLGTNPPAPYIESQLAKAVGDDVRMTSHPTSGSSSLATSGEFESVASFLVLSSEGSDDSEKFVKVAEEQLQKRGKAPEAADPAEEQLQKRGKAPEAADPAEEQLHKRGKAPEAADPVRSESKTARALAELDVSEEGNPRESEPESTVHNDSDATKLDVRLEDLSDDTVLVTSSEAAPPLIVTTMDRRCKTADDVGDWTISFEQFFPSILTEPALCEFFERKHEILDAVARLRNRHVITRQTSSTSLGSFDGDPPSPARTPVFWSGFTHAL